MPPMVTVAATGPADVCITSLRMPATRRSAATARSSPVQLLRTMPNLLPDTRPIWSLPHLRLQALGHGGDHLFADVEPIGLVDTTEFIDRGQEEAAGGAQLQGLLDGGLEQFHHARPVKRTRQGIEAREIGELFFPLVSLVDDANDPASKGG